MNEDFRKLYRKITFLNSDLEISKEIYEDAFKGFNQALQSRRRIELEMKDTPTQEAEELPGSRTENQELEDGPEEIYETHKSKNSQNSKKIFRQIVKNTHPDLLINATEFEEEYKKNLFDKAREAMAQNDFYTLAYVAKKLKLSIPEITKEELISMQQKASQIDREILDLKNTYPWIWHHKGSIDEKDRVLDVFIESISD